MKNNKHNLLATALLFVLLIAAPGNSYALFGGEKSKLLKQADATFIEAQTANAEGRILDEMSLLTESRALYKQLSTKYPAYNTEYVATQFNKCSIHLRALNAQINSGKISVPSPDEIVKGKGAGFVDQNAIPEAAPKPSTPDFNPGLPPLVSDSDIVTSATNTEATSVLPPSKEQPADLEKTAPVTKASDEPVEDKTDFSKPTPTPVPAKAEARQDDPPAKAESVIAGADDKLRIMLINELIKSNEASDAVMMLEDVLAKEGEKASEVTQILFVRSLMDCRNYKRAGEELKKLVEKNPSLPSARSLSAALAVQKGDLTEAVFQLDRLIQDYPTYSDAYVNMAYVYFMMDPVKNRDMAIVYYKSALSYGAKRDPRLESELIIEITP